MSAIRFETKVLSNEAVAPQIFRLKTALCQPCVQAAPRPGQFYMLRAWDKTEMPLLARPISVHDWEPEHAVLTFLYQVKGSGTQKLAALQKGETLVLTGPCGNGFALETIAPGTHVAVVGGGIGIAPLLPVCRALASAREKPDFFAGFRDVPYDLEEFVPCCASVHVATDSGAAGYHGLVTGILNPEQYGMVLACGPMPMLRGVAALCREKNVRCLVSLERKMACGLGACLGCTIEIKKEINGEMKSVPRTVCKDGPVFDAQEVFGR
jgi:dihydroorotate dehydrogenase electron transfer subunit